VKLLLDTNVVIAALNGAPNVASRLNSLDASDDVLLSAIVLAELRFGALCSARRAENLSRVDALAALFGFVGVNRAVAERFAEIKAELRSRGISKSDADLLIAATALVEGAVLVTGDRALLDGEIGDLPVECWLDSGRPEPSPSKP
jgi:predicted nucleic acid-binding protein